VAGRVVLREDRLDFAAQGVVAGTKPGFIRWSLTPD